MNYLYSAQNHSFTFGSKQAKTFNAQPDFLLYLNGHKTILKQYYQGRRIHSVLGGTNGKPFTL
jgi:hypothetical protein